MAGSQGRVTSEGEFASGAEDPHGVVGCWIRCRHDKGGFGEIRPLGESVHLLRRQACSVEYDGDGITESWLSGEYVYLREGTRSNHAKQT
jgi:hypothetical protein